MQNRRSVLFNYHSPRCENPCHLSFHDFNSDRSVIGRERALIRSDNFDIHHPDITCRNENTHYTVLFAKFALYPF